MRGASRLLVPGALVVLLVTASSVDGFFRDEFYYLACTRHLAWGYVDQPPLSIALLWIIRLLFGESLLVLRVAAALAAAASVWLTGSIARRMGAGAFGELLATIGFGLVPQVLAIGSFYSMNVFELLIWTAAVRLLIDTIERPSDMRWILLGTLLGLGLENKISVLWLGGGIAAGLVSTRYRRLLLTPGPWVATLIAAVIFLPHVFWQINHSWPTLEFMRNASRDKMQVNTPVSFLVDQVRNMHPWTLPIWGAGLVALFVSPRVKSYRMLGILFLTVLAILIANRTSRSVYLLPAYPALFAAGGVWWESRIRGSRLRAAAVIVLTLGLAVTIPLAIPVLPVDRYVRYSAALGAAPGTEERTALGRLPQFFADRQGWNRFVAEIEDVWHQLPADEQRRAVVMAGNYGEAGAIERLAGRRGLRAISGHNNYWLWGPDGATGDVLIVLTRNRARLEQFFTTVEQRSETDCGDCMPYENHLPIYVCRGLKTPLVQVWPSLKHYE
jgi:4-amino-4-deoxy-L-arabinose transferase-like glycosyltransferase